MGFADVIWRRLYRLERREFQWPHSAIYSRIASVMEPAYEHIARQIALPQDTEAVLDIGGGDGRLAVALARRYPSLSRIVTADISKDMARRARKRAERNGLGHRIRSEVNDVHSLSYEDSRFDAIISFGSMHHWREPVKALRELDRVLKPKGILAVMDGYDRPSFSSIRETVALFGGSTWTAIAYWIGSKDVLPYDKIANVVRESEIRYISISCDGPVVTLKGVKEQESPGQESTIAD